MKRWKSSSVAAMAALAALAVSGNVESAEKKGSRFTSVQKHPTKYYGIANKTQEVSKPKEPVSEVELLNKLDKPTRSLYHSLDSDGKLLARELASAFPKGEGEKIAVETAAKHTEDQRLKNQEHMLHRGMNRFHMGPSH